MDSIPNPDNKDCRNCGYSLPLDAKYCSQCSQKYTTGKVSIFSFIQEFISEHFNLDSKLISTLGSLFIPGKLTNEYFKGKHKSYASPLRMFLVTAILFFTIAGANDLFVIDLNSETQQDDFRKKVFLLEMDSTIQILKTEFKQEEVTFVLDSLVRSMNSFDSEMSDSLDLTDFHLNNAKLPKVDFKEFLRLEPKALVDKYLPEAGFWEKFLLAQALKAFKQGNNLGQYVISKLSLGILFMMPFLAMFLKVLYFRQKRFYVEHLVFSFHFHAFLFLAFGLVSILTNYLPEYLIAITSIYTFVYLFLALKKVYQQSWIKTVLSLIILISAYSFLLVIFLLLTILISFLLF